MTENLTASPSDWSWLADSYWYVPVENLPALRFDESENALSWVVDQTVWHVTGFASRLWDLRAGDARRDGGSGGT